MAADATTWDAIPLDDLTEEETPITYGVVKPGEEGEVPFVRGGDIAGGRVLMEQLRTIGRDVSQQYRRTLLRGGEILVSLVGNPGQIAIAPPSLAGANIARQVGLVRLKPGIDTRFVSYFLQSRNGQTALGAQSLGSVQQVINLRDLKTVKVPLPPLSEQKAIAAVLGALDDKIELNRRMNATLEAMARALFQSWFVDFDPVRQNMDAKPCLAGRQASPSLIPEAANGLWFTYAIECQGGSLYIGQTDDLRRRWKQHVDGKGDEWTKAHPPVALVFWETHNSLEAAVAREAKLKSGSGREWLKQEVASRTSVRLPAGEAGAKLDLPAGKAGGRPPAALDPATAALFPDSFQDSELGPIPFGWTVSKLKDLTSKIGSGATPRGGSEVYVDEGPALIRSQNVYDHEFHWAGLARLTDKSASELKNVEVVKDDVLLNITGDSILRTCVVDPVVLPARVHQHVAIIRAIKGIPARYLHLYLVQDSMKSFLIGMSAGATRHAITKGHLESTDVLAPCAPVLAAFEKLTAPWFDQIDSNRTQSRTLAALRDTLLPKLLSGELSVAQIPNV